MFNIAVAGVCKFSYKLISHLIICCNTLALDFFAHFRWKVSQAFATFLTSPPFTAKFHRIQSWSVILTFTLCIANLSIKQNMCYLRQCMWNKPINVIRIAQGSLYTTLWVGRCSNNSRCGPRWSLHYYRLRIGSHHLLRYNTSPYTNKYSFVHFHQVHKWEANLTHIFSCLCCYFFYYYY